MMNLFVWFYLNEKKKLLKAQLNKIINQLTKYHFTDQITIFFVVEGLILIHPD